MVELVLVVVLVQSLSQFGLPVVELVQSLSQLGLPVVEFVGLGALVVELLESVVLVIIVVMIMEVHIVVHFTMLRDAQAKPVTSRPVEWPGE